MGVFYAQGQVTVNKKKCAFSLEADCHSLYIFEKGGILNLTYHGDLELFVALTNRVDVCATGTIRVRYLDTIGNKVELISKEADIYVDYLKADSAKSDVRLTARNSIFVSELASSGTAGTVIAGGDITLKAKGGKVDLRGNLCAGDDVDIKTLKNGSVTVTGSITAKNQIRLCSAENMLLQGQIVSWSGAIMLEVEKSLKLSGSLIALQSVMIRADADIFSEALIMAGGDVKIRSHRGAIKIFGNITSNDDIKIVAYLGLTITSDLKSGDDIRLKSKKDDVSIDGNISAADDVDISAGAKVIITGTITAGDEIHIHSYITNSGCKKLSEIRVGGRGDSGER